MKFMGFCKLYIILDYSVYKEALAATEKLTMIENKHEFYNGYFHHYNIC